MDDCCLCGLAASSEYELDFHIQTNHSEIFDQQFTQIRIEEICDTERQEQPQIQNVYSNKCMSNSEEIDNFQRKMYLQWLAAQQNQQLEHQQFEEQKIKIENEKLEIDSFKPFHCYTCQRNFRFKGDLKSHTRFVHEKLRPYKCSECAKLYTTPSKLKSHVQAVHEKLKPHQ